MKINTLPRLSKHQELGTEKYIKLICQLILHFHIYHFIGEIYENIANISRLISFFNKNID